MAGPKLSRAALISAAILLLAGGVAYAEEPAAAEPQDDRSPVLSEPVTTPTNLLEELVAKSSPRSARHGFASYYAARFIGRKTTSGQRYDPDKLTAAHYSLPLGTMVRVVNPATGQEVSVIVNDRCAPKKFPFIDLSRAAAKKIGLWGKGKIKVVIIPLMEEKLKRPA